MFQKGAIEINNYILIYHIKTSHYCTYSINKVTFRNPLKSFKYYSDKNPYHFFLFTSKTIGFVVIEPIGIPRAICL
jgi:hypothetical protein